MKYIKAAINYSFEDAPLGKIRLHDTMGFAETPWIRKYEGQDHVVLANEALMFIPYRSWGVLLFTHDHNYNPLPLIEGGILYLHPDMWEEYLSSGFMDADGNAAEDKSPY